MVCANCGTVNPQPDATCFKCGSPLAVRREEAAFACPHHPLVAAPATCPICEASVCPECMVAADGELVCPICAASVRTRGEPTSLLTPEAIATSPRASLGVRLEAALLDALLLSIGAMALAMVFWVASGFPVGSPAGGWANTAYWALVLAGSAVYFTATISASGQTPGQSACNLVVVAYSGQALSPARAALRFVGSLLSAAALMAGYLWMLRDPDRRAWHDLMAGSIVVAMEEAGI